MHACTIVLGYAVELSKCDNSFIDRLIEAGVPGEFSENEDLTCLDGVDIFRDAERHFIYFAFWHEYVECGYHRFPQDYAKLAEFREKVEKLKEKDIIPKAAAFGIYTYY